MMNISCPECRTEYQIDETKIPTRTARTRCKKCGSAIPIVVSRSNTGKKRPPSTNTRAAEASSPAPAQRSPRIHKIPASINPEQTNSHADIVVKRFAAFLIDAAILLTGTWGLFSLIALVLPDVENWQFAGGFSLSLIYLSLGNSAVFKGRTVGKRLMGIRTQNGAGSPIFFPRSILRGILMIGPLLVALLIFPLCELGHLYVILTFAMLLSTQFVSFYLFLCNTHTRQSLHDLITGTYVVAVDARGRVQTAPFWKWHAVVAGVLVLVISVAVFFIFPVGGLA